MCETYVTAWHVQLLTGHANFSGMYLQTGLAGLLDAQVQRFRFLAVRGSTVVDLQHHQVVATRRYRLGIRVGHDRTRDWCYGRT